MNKKDRRKIRAVTGLLVLALIVVGSFVSANAASAKLNKKKATVTVGKTVKLKVKNTGKAVKWTSSNKKVATVKKSGKYGAVVTGKKAGKATITAKVGSKKLKCKVTVKKASSSTNSSSVTVYGKSITDGVWRRLASYSAGGSSIPKGYTMKLKVTGGNISSVSSTKSSVLSIKKTGSKTAKITAKKAGSAFIKLKINGKNYKFFFGVQKDDSDVVEYKNSKDLAKKVDVSVQTSLTHADIEQECRRNTNVPADMKMLDTVTISITNRNNKSVKITSVYMDRDAILGKRFKNKIASYGFSLRGTNEEWVPYCFYRTFQQTEWMKTITVKPGETKSITYCMHIDISEYLQDYIEYVDGKYGEGYLENQYDFAGITDKTDISVNIAELPQTSTSGSITCSYYPAASRMETAY